MKLIYTIFVSIIISLIFISNSYSQGVIQQFGPLIAGDAIMSQGNNRAVDAGNATTPTTPGTRPTSFGVVNSGCGYAQWDQDPGANVTYDSLCLGFLNGYGLLSYANIGTSAKGFIISANPNPTTLNSFNITSSGAHVPTQLCSDNSTLIATDSYVQNCFVALTSPFLSDTSQLAFRPTTAGSVIIVSTTAPSVTYNPSNSSCLILDGGSCFAALGGGSWQIQPQTVYDIRWWGLSGTPTFYVNNVSGNVNAANFCVAVSIPCASIGQALAAALKFDLANSGAVISIANTGSTYTQSVAINGVGRGQASSTPFAGSASLPLITFVGTGSPAPVVNNDSHYCYTFLANNGAMAAIGGNLTITATNNGCASALYSQYGGTWFNNGAGTTLGPASANLWIGEEGGYFINTAGCNSACDGYLTFGGDAASAALNATAGSGFDSDSAITLSGTRTYTYLLWASQNSWIKSFAASGIFGSGASVVGPTTFRFRADQNSAITLDAVPRWPASSILGEVDRSGTYVGLDDIQACIGGSVNCAATNAPTGLGTGVALNMTFLGVRSGAITLEPGTGALSGGSLYIAFPYLLVDGICNWNQSSGTGVWATNPAARVDTSGFLSILPNRNSMSWYNGGVSLTPGAVQYLTYTCSSEG